MRVFQIIRKLNETEIHVEYETYEDSGEADRIEARRTFVVSKGLIYREVEEFMLVKIPGCPAHLFLKGAPNIWGAMRGATHTLVLENAVLRSSDGKKLDSGMRSAKLMKTVAYIGVDVDEHGNAVWERWGREGKNTKQALPRNIQKSMKKISENVDGVPGSW